MSLHWHEAMEDTMQTIGDLERAAGITDRAAFWAQFSHISGTVKIGHKLCDAGLQAGIDQLRWMIANKPAEA